MFERTPQRVELTIAGRALAERARVIVTEVDRARADVRAAGTERERLTLRAGHVSARTGRGHMGSLDASSHPVGGTGTSIRA